MSRGVGDPTALSDEYARAHAADRGLYGEASSRAVALLPGYARVALRHLARNKVYSFINIAGLAVGIACSFLILLYVADEYGFDRFHSRADHIYRVTTELRRDQGVAHTSQSTAPAIPLLKSQFPEVLEAVRILDLGRRPVRHEGEGLHAEDALAVDSTFFDVFDFSLLQGDPGAVLRSPLSVVLTEGLARKLYGDADAVGKTFTLRVAGLSEKDIRVDGVAADTPPNSHIEFDLLIPFGFFEAEALDNEGMRRLYEAYVMNWQNQQVVSYVVLDPAASAAALEARLPAFVARHRGEDEAMRQVLYLEPMTDIYLRSALQNVLSDVDGYIRYVYLLVSIAALILLIACINFVNLTTARSARRAREIGMRKVLGAHRRQLVWQFLGESVLMVLLALVLALAGIRAVLPAFNDLAGKEFAVALLAEPRVWGGQRCGCARPWWSRSLRRRAFCLSGRSSSSTSSSSCRIGSWAMTKRRWCSFRSKIRACARRPT